jgi:hypothetical protein
MIWLIAWLLPRPWNYAVLTVMCILTGIAGICLWFKGAHENGEIALTHGMPPVILREGSEVWLAEGQVERKLAVTRIKPMKDGKGFTLFVGKHSVRKPKETPSIPVEFGDAEPPL